MLEGQSISIQQRSREDRKNYHHGGAGSTQGEGEGNSGHLSQSPSKVTIGQADGGLNSNANGQQRKNIGLLILIGGKGGSMPRQQ